MKAACGRAGLSRCISESKFESMGEDLMVEIFLKVGGQNLKSVVRLRCVSKSWRRLVNSRCLHRLTYNDPLELKGHLMKMEFGGRVKIEHPPPLLAYTAHRCQGDNHHFIEEEEEESGRRLLEKINNRALIFLDACNGLFLHRLNNNNPTSPPVYRVSNLETNSWVVVIGEPDTADSMYNKTDHAALAYDPAESLVSFKIVAFLQHRCMRIYSSKTGKWSPDLHFDHLINTPILNVRWIQQSVYLNGAIYRLPIMAYLLRFETDEENCDQPYAQAIRLPAGTDFLLLSSSSPIHVGINKGQLNLALRTIFYGLKVWVLQEEGHGNNYSYQWILQHHIRKLEMPAGLVLSSKTGPLGFHPYEDAIVLYTMDDFHFRFICCHLDRNLSVPANYPLVDFTLDEEFRVPPYSFPLFSLAVPLYST